MDLKMTEKEKLNVFVEEMGKTLEQIAETLGCSKGTMRNALIRFKIQRRDKYGN